MERIEDGTMNCGPCKTRKVMVRGVVPDAELPYKNEKPYERKGTILRYCGVVILKGTRQGGIMGM